MPGREKAKENEREKLFQVKRKKCAQKKFDRADIVRDVRFRRLPDGMRRPVSAGCIKLPMFDVLKAQLKGDRL